MKLFLVTITAMSILVAACEQKKSSTVSEKETIDTVSTIMSTEKVDSFAEAKVSLSENELKDDSVFTDGSIPTSWENAGVTDSKGLKLFLKHMQVLVMNNEKAKIAKAIAYPLKGIKNEQEFIAGYDKIFTKEVKLSFATLNFSQLFRNQHGVMTDGGKVWIQQFDSAFKIFAINP